MIEQAVEKAALVALLQSMQKEMASLRLQEVVPPSGLPSATPLSSSAQVDEEVPPQFAPSAPPSGDHSTSASNAGEDDSESGSTGSRFGGRIRFEDDDDEGAIRDSKQHGGRSHGRVPIGRVLSPGEDPGGGMFRLRYSTVHNFDSDLSHVEV